MNLEWLLWPDTEGHNLSVSVRQSSSSLSKSILSVNDSTSENNYKRELPTHPASRNKMSKLQPTETSSLDIIQSVIKDPSIKPSAETIKVLFSNISSSGGLVRVQALKALASVLQHQESHGPAWFESTLESMLHSTLALEVCDGFAALAATWSISPDQALQFLQTDGFFSRLAESVLKLAASRPEQADLNKFFSDFLACCLDHKSLCAKIQSEWPECLDWLTGMSMSLATRVSIPARCGAILALLKLRRSTDLQSAPIPSSDQLVDFLMISFLGNKNPPNSAIESLALLSEDESVRKTLRERSEAFFQTTKSLTQSDRDHEADQIKFTPSRSLAFGLATVILHLVSFKVLTHEFPADDEAREQQERRRRRMLLAERHYWPWEISLPEQDRAKEKHDRELLTGDASPQLKTIITKVWLNLVEYDDCATLVSKSGGPDIVLDMIINTPKFSGYLLQQQPPGTPALVTNSMSTLSSLVLDPHELEMIQVLANLRCPTENLQSMIKSLIILLLHPSSTKFQISLALRAISGGILCEGAKPEVLGCSQLLDQLDQLMVSEFSQDVIELMHDLIYEPAYLKRFAPPSPANSTQTDIAYITRLQNLISLMKDGDDPRCIATDVFYSLTWASPEACQTIVSDSSLTESLLEAFRIRTKECPNEDNRMPASEMMIVAFQHIYDNLPCPSEGDPPALFVDDRLHYGLLQIDLEGREEAEEDEADEDEADEDEADEDEADEDEADEDCKQDRKTPTLQVSQTHHRPPLNQQP
ncbi:hypothetical protein PTTG_07823 [Puccinia triticina 1-1 BBBD Race 1]|uniref:Uncharacterized protein n=1 Tax=Puccinia triticina (isolate 1-1 / race 1 (BBBD)) TaxID=630390 RepID=A0A180GF62_PUCT1|nr:hypothetical protein PTTG_07823 [Puccinia triticina 1-1 BBBD Race 1]